MQSNNNFAFLVEKSMTFSEGPAMVFISSYIDYLFRPQL